MTRDHASASVANAWHAGLLTVAIVATSPPPATRTAADTRPCDDAIRDPQPLRIRIASQPDVDEDVLAQARIEVEMIWRPYGIAVVWQRAWWNDTDGPQPVLFVHIVDTPARVDNAEHTLAWLVFADGRPLPYARVSLPAAMRRVATASLFEGKSLADAPREVQRQALGRVIGRALAHEIGHFLLGSTEHASVGLMARMIEGPLLVHPGRGYFTLTRVEVRALRAARLDRCERARQASR